MPMTPPGDRRFASSNMASDLVRLSGGALVTVDCAMRVSFFGVRQLRCGAGPHPGVCQMITELALPRPTGQLGVRCCIMSTLLQTQSFIVVDIETTGYGPPEHAITEIAALRIWQGQVTDRYATLVNPRRAIP